jgi:hypothetical protein
MDIPSFDPADQEFGATPLSVYSSPCGSDVATGFAP